LFVDENTGCSGLSIDVKNPRVIYAGTWQVEMHTYGEFSGGAGSGVYVSRDGGSTWSRVTRLDSRTRRLENRCRGGAVELRIACTR